MPSAPPEQDSCHLCFCCLQSSSPSYLLMASLDAARAQAQQPGAWEGPLQAARQIRTAMCALSEHVTILGSSESLQAMWPNFARLPLQLFMHVLSLASQAWLHPEYISCYHQVIHWVCQPFWESEGSICC